MMKSQTNVRFLLKARPKESKARAFRVWNAAFCRVKWLLLER